MFSVVWISEQTVIISLYKINWLARARSQVFSCHLLWSRWHWGRFFSQYFCFPLSVSFYQCCIIIIYTFLLPEGQTDEAWEPSKKSNAVTEIGKHWTFTFFSVCRSDMCHNSGVPLRWAASRYTGLSQFCRSQEALSLQTNYAGTAYVAA